MEQALEGADSGRTYHPALRVLGQSVLSPSAYHDLVHRNVFKIGTLVEFVCVVDQIVVLGRMTAGDVRHWLNLGLQEECPSLVPKAVAERGGQPNNHEERRR